MSGAREAADTARDTAREALLYFAQFHEGTPHAGLHAIEELHDLAVAAAERADWLWQDADEKNRQIKAAEAKAATIAGALAPFVEWLENLAWHPNQDEDLVDAGEFSYGFTYAEVARARAALAAGAADIEVPSVGVGEDGLTFRASGSAEETSLEQRIKLALTFCAGRRGFNTRPENVFDTEEEIPLPKLSYRPWSGTEG